jgi:uncharacterized damage-inducible protein DinB
VSESVRFVKMYEASLDRMFLFLKEVQTEQFQHVPVESDANYLGQRVKSITIENVLRHILIAEEHWLRTIADSEFIGEISLPSNVVSDGKFGLDDAEVFYKKQVLPQLKKIEHLSNTALETLVEFNHHQYTKMGFLWTLLTHQTYHLGQIDLLMRQQNIVAPEFMETYGNRQLIG